MFGKIASGLGAAVAGIGIFGFLKPLHMKFRIGDKVFARTAGVEPEAPDGNVTAVLGILRNNPDLTKLPGQFILLNTVKRADGKIGGTLFLSDNLATGMLDPNVNSPNPGVAVLQGTMRGLDKTVGGFIRVTASPESIVRLERGLDGKNVRWSMFETLS